MTQKSSQDVSSIHEEQLWILVYHLTVCRPLGSVAWTCRLWERVCPYMWLAVGTTWFSCFWRFWRCCGVFQGSVWLTKVVPSILRVQWVHTGALSVDVDASGSFRGSLNRGLWERVCPYMWANYNVKPSTSKIENFIKLYRSQIWPTKVVRMLVLSMKNNFEYLPPGRVGGLNMPIIRCCIFKNDANQWENAQTRKYVEVWRPYKSNERSTERAGT